MFTPNLLADASHDVRAPGGYEWWYFDAEDPATDTQIVAIYLHGFIFHPGYLRAYARYVRRPTKTLPPLPGDFACMYFVVYRGGRILHQFMTQVPPNAYAAARDAVDVTVGPSTLTRDADGLKLRIEGTPWKLTGRGPQTLVDQRLHADLTFAPSLPHAPQERRFLSRAMTGADHHWVIASPLCDVRGEIRLDPIRGGAGEVIHFTGRGYHDHNYGTAPLGPGLAKWIWGRAIVGGRVVTFHYAVPRDRTLPAESHLVTADADGVTEQRVLPEIRFDRRTAVGLAFPSRIAWPDVMTLTNPRVIDASPFYLRLQYDADIGGQRTTAFCEAAYPHRLRWPVLGRMIEMSIDKRLLKR
ncbi:MAG TPA: hypothetical protein VF595_00820 [Tepidisphaeraceae bacterium]